MIKRCLKDGNLYMIMDFNKPKKNNNSFNKYKHNKKKFYKKFVLLFLK